ncbi:MAG: hypothetical protein Q4E45_04285 [Eubacteriales bacterium]|nr:hypothetical protein [Eubacteriales bacterium]
MKNLLKAILATVLGLSLLAAASAVTKPPLNKARNRAEYRSSLYYSESVGRMPKNSLDVVFIGSSQVYDSFTPMEMWREQGVAGYCCTSSGQQAVTSYYYLRSFLRRQTPRVVVVETMGLKKEAAADLRKKEYYNRSALDQMPFSAEKIALARELWKGQENGESFFSYLLPVLRFHSRWKELTETDFSFRESYDCTRGYDLTNSPFGYPLQEEDFPFLTEEPTDALAEWDEDAAGWYRKMGELCAQRGIRLLLIKTPCYNRTIEDRNMLRKLASECGAEAMDFNDEAWWERMGYDYKSDMYDRIHLNSEGAKKFSVFFAEMLRRDYGLPDHRGEESYAFWDRDLEIYDRQLDARSVAYAWTGTELRSLVLNGDYEMLVVGMENAEPAFAEALGIPPGAESMWVCRWDGTRANTEYTEKTRGFFGPEEYEIDDTGIYMHGENYMVGDGGLYYVIRDRLLDKIIDYGTVDPEDALRRS